MAMSKPRYLPEISGNFFFSKFTVIMHIIRNKITLKYSALKCSSFGLHTNLCMIPPSKMAGITVSGIPLIWPQKWLKLFNKIQKSN